MSRPRWSGLLVIGAFLLALPAIQARPKIPPGLKEPPPHVSHYVPDDLLDLGNVEEALNARLRQSLIQKLLANKGVREELNNQVRDKLGRGLKPEDLKLFEQMLPNNPELLNDPALRDKLQKLLQANAGALSDEDRKRFAELAKPVLEQLRELAKTRPAEIYPPPPFQGGGMIPTPTQPPAPEPLKEFVTRQLTNLADNLQKSNHSEDGSALRDAIRQLNRFGLSDSKYNLDGLKTEQLDSLTRLVKSLSTEHASSLHWGQLTRTSLPSLPSLPRFQLPSVSAPRWSGGGSSTPSFSFEGSGTGLIWLALLALLALLAWRSGFWLGGGKSDDKESAWRLGAWPIAPAQVTTRGDLVRAFEYLALLVLGPTARVCHHHDLANRLGQQGNEQAPERREAAERLAELYEQARYAPEQAREDVPLPPGDQALARQALCLLAGVSPA